MGASFAPFYPCAPRRKAAMFPPGMYLAARAAFSHWRYALWAVQARCGRLWRCQILPCTLFYAAGAKRPASSPSNRSCLFVLQVRLHMRMSRMWIILSPFTVRRQSCTLYGTAPSRRMMNTSRTLPAAYRAARSSAATLFFGGHLRGQNAQLVRPITASVPRFLPLAP